VPPELPPDHSWKKGKPIYLPSAPEYLMTDSQVEKAHRKFLLECFESLGMKVRADSDIIQLRRLAVKEYPHMFFPPDKRKKFAKAPPPAKPSFAIQRDEFVVLGEEI
jgi:hypothetical protein